MVKAKKMVFAERGGIWSSHWMS